MSRIVYSCLRGKVHAYAPAQPLTNPHLWVILQTPDQKLWFATINVRSDKDAASDPVGRSYLYYGIDTDFSHPIVPTILARPQGVSRVGRSYDEGAVDFQRGNLFDPNVLRVSPSGAPGDEGLVQRICAMLDVAKSQGAEVFFYGNAFTKDNPHQTDAAFGYTPDSPVGIDCVHMAQGDAHALDVHLRENGWWHDGACFMWEEHAHRMSAIFLAFQVQSWHTDDWGQPVSGATGHEAPIYDFSSGAGVFTPPQKRALEITSLHRLPDGSANAVVCNMTTAPLDLTGWSLLADADRRQSLPAQSLDACTPLPVPLPQGFVKDSGGILSLFNPQNLKVDGVAFLGGSPATGWSDSFR